MGFVALAAGRFKEAAQNAVVLQAVFRAGAEDRLASDDGGTQAPLGLVIGGRHLWPAEAGEEVLEFISQQALAKRFGSGVAQGTLA